MLFSRCPGLDAIPPIEIRPCPYCNEELEFSFSELRVTCPGCGQTVLRDRMPSCIDWCAQAKECFGEVKWREINEVPEA